MLYPYKSASECSNCCAMAEGSRRLKPKPVLRSQIVGMATPKYARAAKYPASITVITTTVRDETPRNPTAHADATTTQTSKPDSIVSAVTANSAMAARSVRLRTRATLATQRISANIRST